MPDCRVNGDIQYSVDPSEFIDVPAGMKWECIMCGSCCRNAFSRTWLDIALRDHIGDPIDDHCRHYDPDLRRCQIHSHRPNICRGYPFILRKDGEAYKVQIHSRCPGIGTGEEVDPGSTARMLVELSEDEFGIEFIIKGIGKGEVRLYRIH